MNLKSKKLKTRKTNLVILHKRKNNQVSVRKCGDTAEEHDLEKLSRGGRGSWRYRPLGPPPPHA